MSVTAIALAADYKKLQDLIESGTELTPEMIADTLEGIEGALGDKLDATFSFVRNIEGLAKTCDEEAKRLADRKKSFETQAKNIRQYILNCLIAAGKDSLKTTYNTFSAAKGRASVIIDDESKLPDELVSTTVVTAPDKKAILEAIEGGVDILGAHIEIGPRSLRVR
ncbi:siphovirus Gp157 family protein [Martelella alba]|uniref:Siphovirus Gp157 family protein n=1 Tax=Martelella alba TaxID=2590451 RepID=A0ABY2SDL2_9HYPH|nr:siphovirus Gp157 family protein [Martelella alba]TKI02565.1 siphovirus Gp157 family protein [Martelella alba]